MTLDKPASCPRKRPTHARNRGLSMVSFEKRTAAIISLKQTQVMQVRIQSTKRKYVKIIKKCKSQKG